MMQNERKDLWMSAIPPLDLTSKTDGQAYPVHEAAPPP